MENVNPGNVLLTAGNSIACFLWLKGGPGSPNGMPMGNAGGSSGGEDEDANGAQRGRSGSANSTKTNCEILSEQSLDTVLSLECHLC